MEFKIKVKRTSQIPKEFTGIVEYQSGEIEYLLNGKKHRVDGPAIIFKDGDKQWWLNGKLHREDGPAIEYFPYKEWWFNGKKHRVDGPAIEDNNGEREWYLNGINYSQEEWFELLSEEDKLNAIWNLR